MKSLKFKINLFQKSHINLKEKRPSIAKVSYFNQLHNIFVPNK